MSTDYRIANFADIIPIKEFKDRLQKYAPEIEVMEEENGFQLKDPYDNYLYVYKDGNDRDGFYIMNFTRYGHNNPGLILDIITSIFDVTIVDEYNDDDDPYGQIKQYAQQNEMTPELRYKANLVSPGWEERYEIETEVIPSLPGTDDPDVELLNILEDLAK